MNPIEALAWLFGMATMFTIVAMVTFMILFDELKLTTKDYEQERTKATLIQGAEEGKDKHRKDS